MKHLIIILIGILIVLESCNSKPNQQSQVEAGPEFREWAETPPMRWNSWDCYGPTVTESEVKANTDYMAEHLLKHGWQYVVVDIR